MDLLILSRLLLWLILLVPLAVLALHLTGGLIGCAASEKQVHWVFHFSAVICVAGALLVAAHVQWTGKPIDLWVGGSLLYRLDGAASLFLAEALGLLGIAGNFSLTYLHRDPGFHRYFVAYALFFLGICQVFCAANVTLFIAGWELIGISSVMLIAYFQERAEPVKNSRFTYGFYRFGDVGILSGLAMLCHINGTELLPWLDQDISVSSVSAALAFGGILVGAAVKMSLLPFVSWLPRAMEGPTPSSAVYYGALSVHAGAFLLWRVGPQIMAIPGCGLALVVLGLATALFAAWCGRIRSDVKTQLAYSSMAQLGLICAEIGLGWQALAMWHSLGHMGMRSLQFLSAPSALHTFRVFKIARPTARRVFHVETLLPPALASNLYRLGLAELHLMELLTAFFVEPFIAVGEAVSAFDRRVLAHLRFLLDSRTPWISSVKSSDPRPSRRAEDSYEVEFQ